MRNFYQCKEGVGLGLFLGMLSSCFFTGAGLEGKNCEIDLDCGPIQYCDLGICCPKGKRCPPKGTSDTSTSSGSTSTSSATEQNQAGSDSMTETINDSMNGSSGSEKLGEWCGDGKVNQGEECDNGVENSDDAACTSMCKHAYCGDSRVWKEHEECDDGNPVNTDLCTNQCTVAVCGDQIVLESYEECDDGEASASCDDDCTLAECGDGKMNKAAGEECDDGDSNVDNVEDAYSKNKNDIGCTKNCATGGYCGDNVVQQPQEQCDDGNKINDDDCTNDCKHAYCGDGIVNTQGVMDSLKEECDSADPLFCQDCKRVKFVFRSEGKYLGAIIKPNQGITDIDAICQELWNNRDPKWGGDNRVFKAWISTNSVLSPINRFSKPKGPYKGIGINEEIVIANGWADLVDGTLENLIIYDQNKQWTDNLKFSSVWTCTDSAGKYDPYNSTCCNGWKSLEDNEQGGQGLIGSLSDWSLKNSITCNQSAFLYCFEQ